MPFCLIPFIVKEQDETIHRSARERERKKERERQRMRGWRERGKGMTRKTVTRDYHLLLLLLGKSVTHNL